MKEDPSRKLPGALEAVLSRCASSQSVTVKRADDGSRQRSNARLAERATGSDPLSELGEQWHGCGVGVEGSLQKEFEGFQFGSPSGFPPNHPGLVFHDPRLTIGS